MMKQRFQALLYIMAVLAAVQITGCRSSQPITTDFPLVDTGTNQTTDVDGDGTAEDADNPMMESLEAELVGTADISMSWVWSNANSNDEYIDYYSVERSANGGAFAPIATIAVTGDAETTYQDAPTGGSSFRYRYVIHYQNGESSTSAETAPITVITHLAPPTNVGAVFSMYHAAPFGYNDVLIAWNYPLASANTAGFNIAYTVRDGNGAILTSNMSLGIPTYYYANDNTYDRYHDNIHQVATACLDANAATIEYKVQAIPTNYGINSASVFVSVAQMPCP